MWLYLLQGIGFGFAAAVQPGPFQTYLISQSLLKGWKRTLPAAFAPLLSDGPIIILCVLVLSQIPLWLQSFLYITGGMFILYLAYGAYRAGRNFDSDFPDTELEDQQGIYNAALINALSPGVYIFWTLVTGPILLRGWHETPVNGIGFLAGFYVTMILTLGVIIFLFGIAQGLGQKVNRVMLGISALALCGFGLYQLWLGIHV